MSDNTRNIAFEIFCKEPLHKNAIQLELEESCTNLHPGENIEEVVFEILTMITFHGIEILFGHKNIAILTNDQFDLLQKYTNSYGYKIVHMIKDGSLLISFEKVN